jgi:hypothetical protein
MPFAPTSLLNFPSLQALQAVVLLLAASKMPNLPASQAVHAVTFVASTVVLYLPVGQASQLDAPVVEEENLPAEQDWQTELLVAPVERLAFPIVQASQVAALVAPVAVLNFPTPHLLQEEEAAPFE